VPNEPPTPPDEREWARRKLLLHAVLRYLEVHGPTLWVTLYLHFDPDGTGEIGRALRHLSLCKHIEIEDGTAKITAGGIEYLHGG
jgi:hypothetical protein